MPTTCAVYHCPSPRGLTYHVFPSDPEQASRWAGNWTKRKVLNFRNARICSNHFKESDYKRDLRNELLGLPLRKIFTDPKSVVPTMNLSPVDQDSGDSDDGLDLDKYTKSVKKTLKRKSKGDSNRVKLHRYEEENPIVEIIEYKPNISDFHTQVEHTEEVESSNPSHGEKSRFYNQPNTSSESDWSDADSDSDSEVGREDFEDPFAVIERLKERLYAKNKRIQYLKRKLKYSKSDNNVQFVYVQDLTQIDDDKEKPIFKIMCDKKMKKGS
uniref:THAP-type domain-containing protein n=1 Tax=Lepeophtheirus salmonis TaxID=72036 RepID=A0A0K2VAF1_LEPSM